MTTRSLAIQSHDDIPPGATTVVRGRMQLPFRGTSIYIEPDLAPHFRIEDIRVAHASQMGLCKPFPATELIEKPEWGMERANAGESIDMEVTNLSDKARTFMAVVTGISV